MYYEIRGFMKKRIVFLQPKSFEINFRLWSLTAAFCTRELLQQQAAARDVAAATAFQWWALNFFACSTVHWIQVPIFISSCSSTLTTVRRHGWPRCPWPMPELSNPRSWTRLPRAAVINHPSRAYSMSNHPEFVSLFQVWTKL